MFISKLNTLQVAWMKIWLIIWLVTHPCFHHSKSTTLDFFFFVTDLVIGMRCYLLYIKRLVRSLMLSTITHSYISQQTAIYFERCCKMLLIDVLNVCQASVDFEYLLKF